MNGFDEGRDKLLTGGVMLLIGTVITLLTYRVGGGFVVVTYGLIIVGGLRVLVGLFQMLGSMASVKAGPRAKKWPTRNWVPNPMTVGLLNLNVLGLGYLHQLRWIGWVLHVGLASFLIYVIIRLYDEPKLAVVFIALFALLLIFSAIVSNSAAHSEKRARSTLPVRNDSRLRTIAIALIVAQILLMFALPILWILSARSGNRLGVAATDLALSGDCAGAISLAGELSTMERGLLQRGELDSDSNWIRIEPICRDVLAGISALEQGNYQTAQKKFASARVKTLGVESREALRVQAYKGEAEATLQLATKYISYSGQQKASLIEFLTLVNEFPDTSARQAADLIVPDLSLRVAANARAAGNDPTYWYEQVVLHYPDSPQAETARAALEALK